MRKREGITMFELTEKDFATFSKHLPKENGWYWVIWEHGDYPVKVLVEIFSDNPDIITWRWDETDDPEAYTAEENSTEGTVWKKADSSDEEEEYPLLRGPISPGKEHK
jgi:hypothetical protein